MFKNYLVSVGPAFRSVCTDNFAFVQNSDGYKMAWIDARAALNFGHEIIKVGDETPTTIPPGQYKVRQVEEIKEKKDRKSALTIADFEKAAEAEGISVSSKVRELIEKMKANHSFTK